MQWNSNIDEAPRGEIVEETDDRGKKRRVFRPVRLLTWRPGDEWRVSWWMPAGLHDKRNPERWNFYSVDHPPTHWMQIEVPTDA